ncbi:MAG TPA: Gfo/Idh/MocA family oxidoreductase, partial [Gemmataceae bacterium]|nr:Gfo/Idh/MocA family oxidoreductase [Gemmataceae bacterium]
AALTVEALAPAVYAAGSDMIKVGLVGCGGRGTGAAENVLHSAKGVKIVAIGDVFKTHAEGCVRTLERIAKDDQVKSKGNSVEIPAERRFVGLDAYKHVINHPEVNYVILATSPGFRALHIEEVVNAGKNLFTEKPVSTDGPGIKTVLAAYDSAKKKNLRIAAGTQRRHQAGYIETINRIHNGDIGDVILLRAYWNNQGIWFKNRKGLEGYPEKPTELAYQLYNWYHFCWICGDNIVEQHVHNLDVCNWVMKDHPIRAWGMGSRIGHSAARPDGDPKDVGNIFDNFSIEFEYPSGARMISQCRQIPGTWDSVSEAAHGTRGMSQINAYRINTKSVHGRDPVNPYVQEHTDLIEAIRGGKEINELKQVAESTMTAILGREAAYSGKELTWDKAMDMRRLMDTAHLQWDWDVPVTPVPVPGKYKLA